MADGTKDVASERAANDAADGATEPVSEVSLPDSVDERFVEDVLVDPGSVDQGSVDEGSEGSTDGPVADVASEVAADAVRDVAADSAVPCRWDTGCPSGYYCETFPMDCAAVGVCVEEAPPGSGCVAVVDPVCGCEGNTYDNDCSRHIAGEAKAHDGACDES
jgi:hypothetical protein